MTQELEKALALMQHNGEEYFIHNDVAYQGEIDLKELRERYDEEMKDKNEENDNEHEWEEWDSWLQNYIDDTYTEVDEYDEDNLDYMVLTDEEADEKWDEELDSYIDECILPEIPESYRYYFDDEKWKRDARHDGRGHSLNHYDGSEDEETVNGTTYYIYRIN